MNGSCGFDNVYHCDCKSLPSPEVVALITLTARKSPSQWLCEQYPGHGEHVWVGTDSLLPKQPPSLDQRPTVKTEIHRNCDGQIGVISLKVQNVRKASGGESCATEAIECGPCAKKLYMNPQCKVALITGGATGIGYATANELLANGAYRTVLGGIDPCAGKEAVAKLNAAHGKDKASYINLNVNCPKQFEEAIKMIIHTLGGVDILINNAGVLNDRKWELEIDTNLKSVIRGTLLGFKYMGNESKAKRKNGIIINTLDVVALDVFPPAPMYTASKTGALGATRSLAGKYHYKRTGVRVVGLLSGPTATNMINESSIERAYDEQWGKDMFELFNAKTLQKPVAVGRAVVYVVKYAPTSTLWTVENEQLFRTIIPKRESFNIKVTQL